MTASFWGLVVEPNKLYSQVVPAGFKLSMASLGPQEEPKSAASSTDSPSPDKKHSKSSTSTTLMVRLDEKDDYALCSLTLGQLNQQPLDLVFTEGENIALRVVGDQPVHLTGYYLPDECHDHDDDMESDDDEYTDDSMDEEEELDSEDFEDSEEDSEENDRIKEITSDEETEIKEKKGHDQTTTDEEEEEEEEEEDMSDDISSEEEEEELPPKVNNNKRAAQAKVEDAKKVKVESKKDSPKPTPEPAKKSEQSKKESPKPVKAVEQKAESKVEAKKPDPKQPEKKTLPNGLIIEDIKIGEGIKAQQGRRVGITYKGTLLTTGKTFDTNKGKALFNFTLGKGEVIKGMEQGVQGMALGGERRITVPSALGYGPKGAQPAIPGDATLVFEIKLEKVTNNNNSK